MVAQMLVERRAEALPAEFAPPPPPLAQTPVLERLHALVRKGYVADIGTERDQALVVLRHSGKTPDLVLRSDGVVEPLGGRTPRHKRKLEAPAPFATNDVAEQLRFMTFLDSIPKATLRDRTRRWRRNYLYFPVVLIAVWLACIGLTVMIVEM